MSRPKIGVFDLHDATSWSWFGRRLDRFIAPLGLRTRDGSPSIRASAPPPCVIVIGDLLFPDRFAQFVAWLANASALVVVRRVDEGDDDPELAELIEEQWREAVGDLRVIGWVDWRDGEPAVERALALALHFVDSAACPEWIDETPPALELARLAPTPWLGPASAPPRAGSLAHDGTHAYVVDPSGTLHRLEDQRRIEPWPRAAVRSDRAQRLVHAERGRIALLEADARAELLAAHRYPIGLAPGGPWAWIGSRCMFSWLWAGSRGLALVCDDAREWPCGHAKKLYGYEDNDAEWIEVDPTGASVLSVFEHDALIADAVPMRWTIHADLALMCWPPVDDPLRALLFESDAQHRASLNAEPEDENARLAAPPVVLGRHADARYAVGLARETWRLRGEHAERIGGPEPVFAIYDDGHRLVRRCAGRLLGGSAGLATVEHEGALWREELETGERRRLGPCTAEITEALPIFGTENVLLIDAAQRVRVL